MNEELKRVMSEMIRDFATAAAVYESTSGYVIPDDLMSETELAEKLYLEVICYQVEPDAYAEEDDGIEDEEVNDDNV